MKKIELQNISISDYCNLLKVGTETETINLIDSELSKLLGDFGPGIDLSIFMLQKDLLIFQCKLALAIFDLNDNIINFYENKIEKKRKELERKTVKKEKSNPYKSFLSWVLSVEKYLGFAIDKNNDLLYFSEATKQMLNNYEQQKANIEANKVKK